MIFTGIKVSAGGGEFSFYTEEGERYTISAADAKRLSLAQLSKDDLPFEFEDGELMEFCSKKLSAVKYCTYLLSFSDKSEFALRQKMREKGYVGSVADSALEILRSSGFTNDSSLCAKKYIAIANSKLYGPHRIKAELMAKGFSQADIKNAELECDIDFDELLRELLDKLLRTDRIDFSDRKQAEKFKAKLSRYGYGFGTINSVLEEYTSFSDDDYY